LPPRSSAPTTLPPRASRPVHADRHLPRRRDRSLCGVRTRALKKPGPAASGRKLRMSDLGHSRPMHLVPVPINVRCYSNSNPIVRRSEVTLRATTRLMRFRQTALYSNTSSARCRADSGIVRPSALAVFRLTANSNTVGCSIGSSPGIAPRRIRAT
jgi:hypothetical protein